MKETLKSISFSESRLLLKNEAEVSDVSVLELLLIWNQGTDFGLLATDLVELGIDCTHEGAYPFDMVRLKDGSCLMMEPANVRAEWRDQTCLCLEMTRGGGVTNVVNIIAYVLLGMYGKLDERKLKRTWESLLLRDETVPFCDQRRTSLLERVKMLRYDVKESQ